MKRAPDSPSALRLAIVIPTLDEAETLHQPLTHALACANQVIVSDGGSQDQTTELANRLGARVVFGPPGRGQQLNRGAAACDADILLFLHADTLLPDGANRDIRRAIEEGAVGGGFQAEFDDPRVHFRLGNRLVAWRTSLLRTPLGDQAQFVRREVFEELGGFRDWPILEDLDFVRRLRRAGRIAILAGPVTTSARRFVQQGVLRTVTTNWLIWILFACGVSPHRLARWYRKVR